MHKEMDLIPRSSDVVDGNCMGRGNAGSAKTDDEDDDQNVTQNNDNSNIERNFPVVNISPFYYYAMNHKRRGRAIIFNHYDFIKTLQLNVRKATQKDCDDLSSILLGLGFDVTVYHDLDKREILSTVLKAAKDNHTNCDCFVITVLSHGTLGKLYARDDFYVPDELWSPFEFCDSLDGKPKLFIIQACQGDKMDHGFTMQTVTNSHLGNELEGGVTQTDSLPVPVPEPQPKLSTYQMFPSPDVLICYSTAPGYFSWRNIANGSWCIQSLCDELRKNAYNVHLLTLLTFVCQSVAIDKESFSKSDPDLHEKKQVLCVTHKLTKLLQFTERVPGKLRIFHPQSRANNSCRLN